MNTFIQSLRRLFLGCLSGTVALATVHAATVYDSGGFESPVFIAGQPLANQDPAPPVGNGPWRKDSGTSTAEVVTTNPVEGTKSVKITRAAGATGNTRWAVVKPTTASGLNNVIDVQIDMRVLRKANNFGPMFGIEAYDASLGSPKLIGSLIVDAGSGELVCHQAITGAIKGTGFYPDLVLHHHYRMSLNFTAKTYSLFADGKLVHTESFVDPTVTSFTDASLVTLAAGPGNDDGIAYVDNYRIEQTTSQLPYLLWQGDGIANVWNTGGAPNWHDGFTPVAYSDGKPVRFEDGGSATPALNLQGNLLPSSVTISATQNYALAGPGSIGGTTRVIKEGFGKLTVSNANAYSGDTDLRSGELSVRNTAGSATGSSKVTVFPMCTVSGNGSIAGSLWVASGGVVKPGADGVGTLNVGGILVLDSAALKYELGTTSDRIAVTGDLTLGGTLEVIAAGGYGPGSYDLITYGGSLNAGTLQVTAPSGYDYRVDTATPGVVKLLVTPPPPAPLAPSGLTATTAGSQAIDLGWTDPSDNEDSFVIERGSDSANYNPVATVGNNVTVYTDTGLAPGTTYFYRIRAVNAGGESPYSNVASATTDSSPVKAHYEFELTALDSSGNNNHGVVAGGVLYEAGRVGENAATFGGIGFVEITRVVESNFTVMMWVKTTRTGTGGAWYSGMGLVDGETVGSAADWGCSILNSKFAFGIGAPDTTISSNRNVNDGIWHHVAATRNNETGEVKLYIDGVLDKVGAAPTGPRTAPTQLRIGATQTANPVFYVGAMDDLRFYGSRLSAAEIADAADLPAPPPPPPAANPVVIWPLGDSITWGYTTASAADSPGGYREPLYRNLLVNGYPAMKFVGANTSNPGPLLTRDNQVNHDGYPQYTLSEINANLNTNAPTGKTRGNNGGFWLTGTGGRPAITPDIVLLLAGTNDIEGGAAASLIEQRLDAMVNKIFTLRPATKIFLSSIPPYPADAAKTATAQAYNQLILTKTVPKYLNLGYNIRFVDQYANFVAASPAGDVVITGLYGDTIHPNESGYQLMGDTWAAAILADPLPLPASPTNLGLTATSASAVQISWQDNASTEGAFLIERSSDGVSYQRIGFVGANQTNFADLNLPPYGMFYYRVLARNSTGDSGYSNISSFRTPATYDTWAAAHFTEAERQNLALSGPFADADNDGISNLEEYAYDGDPKISDRGILPRAAIEGGYLTFTFTRLKDRIDINYRVFAGGDLASYSLVAESVLAAPPTAANGGAAVVTPHPSDSNIEFVQVRDSVPISEAAQRFMKAQIQQPQ